jgi:hypothetical protein
MKGEKTLASGNVARWSITDGLGGMSAIEVRLDHESSANDHVEVLALLEELKPPGSRTLERGAASLKGLQAANTRIGELIGRGSSN